MALRALFSAKMEIFLSSATLASWRSFYELQRGVGGSSRSPSLSSSTAKKYAMRVVAVCAFLHETADMLLGVGFLRLLDEDVHSQIYRYPQIVTADTTGSLKLPGKIFYRLKGVVIRRTRRKDRGW
jgi:hypothetical protein